MDRCTAGSGARDGRHRCCGHSVGPHTSASPFRPDWHSALSSANPSLALDPADCKHTVVLRTTTAAACRPDLRRGRPRPRRGRSEEHTSELQSRQYLVCRLLLEKKKTI